MRLYRQGDIPLLLYFFPVGKGWHRRSFLHLFRHRGWEAYWGRLFGSGPGSREGDAPSIFLGFYGKGQGARAAHNLTGLLHPTSSIPRRPKKLRPDKGGGPSALTVGGREAGSVVVSDSFHTFAPWPRSKGRREVPKNGATAKAARRGKRNCQRREKTFSCSIYRKVLEATPSSPSPVPLLVPA